MNHSAGRPRRENLASILLMTLSSFTCTLRYLTQLPCNLVASRVTPTRASLLRLSPPSVTGLKRFSEPSAATGRTSKRELAAPSYTAASYVYHCSNRVSKGIEFPGNRRSLPLEILPHLYHYGVVRLVSRELDVVGTFLAWTRHVPQCYDAQGSMSVARMRISRCQVKGPSQMWRLLRSIISTKLEVAIQRLFQYVLRVIGFGGISYIRHLLLCLDCGRQYKRRSIDAVKQPRLLMGSCIE